MQYNGSMQEPSIFTRIINGEIPAHRVYEDERVIAFLDIAPLNPGHTLVIPKAQIDQLWDVSSDEYVYLWSIAQNVALRLKQVMGTDRVGVIVKGFDVPHAHIHLITENKNSQVSFDPPPKPEHADPAELAALAEKLRFS